MQRCRCVAASGAWQCSKYTLTGMNTIRYDKTMLPSTHDTDIVVVGGGHNGLIAAAYLARSGLRVTVLERRAELGGAAATHTPWPGHRVDAGASGHIVFCQTGIAEDLGLAEHGLEYLSFDPMYVAFLPDGSTIEFWRDLDRTCASIAKISPADADAYRRFVQTWAPAAPLLLDLFSSPAAITSATAHFWNQLQRKGPNAFELLRGFAASPATLVRRFFRDPRVQAPLLFSAAQTGVPSHTAGTGAMLLWFAMIHQWGIPAPRGGSGMLAEALRRKIIALGGTVHAGLPAQRVRSHAEGVVVETADGQIMARSVMMATHLKTTLALLGDALPAATSARLGTVSAGQGCGVLVHLATEGLPAYPGLPDGGADAHRGIQLFCPMPEAFERGWAELCAGVPATELAVALTSPSAFDSTRAPPGRHVMQLWSQWYPYTLAGGRDWTEIAEVETARILDVVSRYMPGLRASVRECRFTSPPVLARELDLAQANLMHLPMTPNRLFTFRPAYGYSDYRLAPNIYMTGASTHPGGGVMGVSGKLAARVVLEDWGKSG